MRTLETPLSLYLKLAHSKDGGKHSFLLESVVGGERFGRYSFIGLPARTLLRASGFGADAKTEVVTDDRMRWKPRAQMTRSFLVRLHKRWMTLRPGGADNCGHGDIAVPASSTAPAAYLQRNRTVRLTADDQRRRDVLCVVEMPADALMIERRPHQLRRALLRADGQGVAA